MWYEYDQTDIPFFKIRDYFGEKKYQSGYFENKKGIILV